MRLFFLLIEGLRIVILVDVVLSWIMRDPRQFPRSLTHSITKPLYAPFQRILPPAKTGGIDLSPLFLLIALSLLERLLH